MTQTQTIPPLAQPELIRRAVLIAAIGTATALLSNGGMIGGDGMMFVTCAGLGAGFAGALTAPLFGRPGARGDALALLGAALATLVGASIGGTLMALLDGAYITSLSMLLLGPAFVALSFADAPAVALLCLGCFVALHLWLQGRDQTR